MGSIFLKKVEEKIRFTKQRIRFTDKIYGLPTGDLECKIMLSSKYMVYQILLYNETTV